MNYPLDSFSDCVSAVTGTADPTAVGFGAAALTTCIKVPAGTQHDVLIPDPTAFRWLNVAPAPAGTVTLRMWVSSPSTDKKGAISGSIGP